MVEVSHDGSGPAAGEFVIERGFDAPRDLVWQAFAESWRLAQWWGPKGFRIRVHKLEFRPGGLFHYYLVSGAGQEMWGRFIYRTIDAPSRLEFVLTFSDAEGAISRSPFSAIWPLEVINTISFIERDGRTIVTLRARPINATAAEQAAFEDGFASMRHGFGGTWDQLEAYLRSVISADR